jgi:NitT/TauT family transport system permease protein
MSSGVKESDISPRRVEDTPEGSDRQASPTGWVLRFRAAGITLVALVTLWQIATDLLEVPVYLLPSPGAIAKEVVENWRMLIDEAAITTFEVLVGFTLSAVIALPLAAIFSYSPAVENATYPLIVGSNTIPKVALAPILLTWFGFGLAPKIIIVVLVAFFPILINTVTGFKSLPLQMIYLARSMGANEAQLFWHFRMPHALPNIFAGFKITIVLCVVGAVVAEFVGSDRGLGYVMMMAASDLNIARQFAAVLVLSVIGIAAFWIVEWAEGRLLPWQNAARNEVV